MKNTLVEIIELFCRYFVEILDLVIDFIGKLLELLMQDYRIFVFLLVCIFIISSTHLIDQIRSLGNDMIKWKKHSNKSQGSNSNGSKKTSSRGKRKPYKKSTNSNKVTVKKNKKDNSEKIELSKEIKTPGVKNTKKRNYKKKSKTV